MPDARRGSTATRSDVRLRTADHVRVKFPRAGWKRLRTRSDGLTRLSRSFCRGATPDVSVTLRLSRAYDFHRWEDDMERRTFVSLPAAMVSAPLISVVGEPVQSLAASRSSLAAPDSLTFESPS